MTESSHEHGSPSTPPSTGGLRALLAFLSFLVVPALIIFVIKLLTGY